MEKIEKTMRRMLLPLKGKGILDKLKLCKFVLAYAVFFVIRKRLKDLSKKLVMLKLNATLKESDILFHLDTVDSAIHYISSFEDEAQVRYAINEDIRKKIGIEVGAHIGSHTVRWAKHYQKLVALEPHPENRRELSKNITINKMRNVVIVDKAAFSKKGKLRLYLSNEGSGSHSLARKVGERSISIDVDTIDNIIKSKGIDAKDVSFMKIDVEGAELEVLKGSRSVLKEGRPVIVFEAWDEDKAQEIKELLKSYGYSQFRQISSINYLAKP